MHGRKPELAFLGVLAKVGNTGRHAPDVTARGAGGASCSMGLSDARGTGSRQQKTTLWAQVPAPGNRGGPGRCASPKPGLRVGGTCQPRQDAGWRGRGPRTARRPRGTYCFMASSLESMLSCLPFISCTSVRSLATLSWRIFMSSFFRVDTWVPGGERSLRRPPREGGRAGDTRERAEGLRQAPAQLGGTGAGPCRTVGREGPRGEGGAQPLAARRGREPSHSRWALSS